MSSHVEYLRKKMIIKEAAEDLQFCFVWIYTVDQSINWNFLKEEQNNTFALLYLRIVGTMVTKQHHKAGEPWLRQSLIPWWTRICLKELWELHFYTLQGPLQILRQLRKESIHSVDSTHLPQLRVKTASPLNWILLPLWVHCEFYLPILHTERSSCQKSLLL